VFAGLERAARPLVVRRVAGAVPLGYDQQFVTIVDNDSSRRTIITYASPV
jgi:hypothetical protein